MALFHTYVKLPEGKIESRLKNIVQHLQDQSRFWIWTNVRKKHVALSLIASNASRKGKTSKA